MRFAEHEEQVLEYMHRRRYSCSLVEHGRRCGRDPFECLRCVRCRELFCSLHSIVTDEKYREVFCRECLGEPSK